MEVGEVTRKRQQQKSLQPEVYGSSDSHHVTTFRPIKRPEKALRYKTVRQSSGHGADNLRQGLPRGVHANLTDGQRTASNMSHVLERICRATPQQNKSPLPPSAFNE